MISPVRSAALYSFLSSNAYSGVIQTINDLSCHILFLFQHTTQLFKATDNSIVATLTHGSRINRACFTSVTTTEADRSSSYRMVTVCDNKTINMFDFSGKQVGCSECSYYSRVVLCLYSCITLLASL